MDRDELIERLQNLFERDDEDAQREVSKVKQAHEAIPALIEGTSELSGIEPMLLVKLAARVAWINNMKWYEVIELLRTFYQFKANLEHGEK